ncbi:acyl-CoA dehydrogenase [Streptomyces sp. SP18CS02]|uniref:acyl-CoA dehydrogenase n=1 Tax=Streptomyces sp. SP18CS02 TaxID=3002531 RepID=UPI002E77388D|nr:acyl-CoA dehydrogenase [Streptomyces sp. SP18CS02]MEE1753800.1 acyl-CoA dehydrogenase [Streptomyces sp. SP18CS02]
MSHYRSNLRDLEFNLFEVLGRDAVYGSGAFADLDGATGRDVLRQVERLAVEELADSAVLADRDPPVFDPRTATVSVPEPLRTAFTRFMDGGWWRLGLPRELGGTDCPPSLYWAMAELVLGANPALWMYSSGPFFASVIQRLGTARQREIARRMVDRLWGATMVLTEPDAGSDVGAARTRALPQPDGTWHIEGVKRFITNGEHDLAENIVHFVLARPQGAGPGTKGLSLFIVPKYDFDPDTGDLLGRNGVHATRLDRKMGLKASTTVELAFGAGQPAKGWLMGDRHDGIRQMFQVIEFARMMVGTKAIAALSTGYLNALDYARSRVQGGDLARAAERDAPRVTITHHPDVRRSLMTQKAYAEGLRALVLYVATIQDGIRVEEAAGEDAEAARGLNDLLLPVLKGYGSEKSYEQLAQSLQILGGSGYLQEYPIEQYIRDAKIDTLYEGTTAIQAQDFFFRKIVRDRGRALTALLREIRTFLADAPDGDGDGDGDGPAAAHGRLARAASDLEAMAGVMLADAAASERAPKAVYRVGLNATRLLLACGDVVVGYLLLRGAAVARHRLATARGGDVAFYRGKIAAAAFFADTVLPLLTAQREIAGHVDDTLMELPEDAF